MTDEKKKKWEEGLLNIGIYLVLFLLMCLCVPALTFLFGGTIGRWMFPVVICIAFVLWITVFRATKITIAQVGMTIGVIALGLLLSGVIFDISWDGNTYHKTAVGLMMDGWNPMDYECMDVLSENQKTQGMAYNAQWINHYANGGWMMSAVIAGCLGNIELGKAINLYSMIAVFCILFYVLKQYISKSWMVLLIAFLAVCNPITLSQVESFYIDGDLYLFLLLCLIGVVGLEKGVLQKRFCGLFLFSAIAMCINLKFTGTVYVGCFCISGFACQMILKLRQEKFMVHFLKNAVMYLVMAAVSIGVLGYTSYVSNYLEKGNPLYPLVGEEKVDIMSYSQPNTFSEMSNPEKSIRSLFGKSANISASSMSVPEVKIPFWVSLSEIKSCMNTDTRVAGMGVWFSSIFILALVVDVLFLWKNRKKRKVEVLLCTAWLCTSLAMFLFVPGGWWMRYSAHLYFFVILSMIAVAKWLEGNSNRWKKAIAILLFCVIGINTACFTLSPASAVYKSVSIWKDKKEMTNAQKSSGQPITVGLKPTHMTGVLWNLKHWGISYEVDEEYQEGMTAYNKLISWSVNMEDIINSQ